MWMRHALQTLVGIVLAATPVALWVAWTPAMLAGVLATSVLCAALLVLLTESSPQAGTEAGTRLSEEFLEQVQGLHPMIYHHSGRRSSRFHRTMQRLSERAGRS